MHIRAVDRRIRRGVAIVLAATSFLSAAPGTAQGVATPSYARGDGESVRFSASAAAATRALNICAGLWQGGLTEELIETELNGRDPTYGKIPAGIATEIDADKRIVSIRYLPDMPPRIVVWRPVLGCVQLPAGASTEMIATLPQVPTDFRAPQMDGLPWPSGDKNAVRKLKGKRGAALNQVVDGAFDGRFGGRTWGVVVVHDGKIVAEKYAEGFGPHIGSQTHSAAKSFAATLAGIAEEKGIFRITAPAPIANWRRPGDPRGAITVEHLLHMASGLYAGGVRSIFKDIYTQGGTVDDLATTIFMDARPGERFQYSPNDTMLVMRSIREAMRDDAAYLRFPYESLYWRIGMTRTTMNGDWAGNYFGSGQVWSTARDFARFGLLYLQNGMWEGERILSEAWVKYATHPAPVQPAKGPGYGAQFWLHGGEEGLPADAYTPQGGQGHFAMVIPSRNIVIVRRGFDEADRFQLAKFSAAVLKELEQ